MRHERPCQGSTGERLQDGSLYLHKAPVFQVTTHGGDDLAAAAQLPGDLRIRDEIDIALAITGLAVL